MALTGKRVHDVEEMLGDGTVLEHDAAVALVQWDHDPSEPTWTRWVYLELIED